MQKEIVVSLNDLQFITIKCPHCQTQVTLDLAREDFRLGGTPFFTPPKCPGCHADFDSAIPENVDLLHGLYRAIPEKVRSFVTFRGKVDL